MAVNEEAQTRLFDRTVENPELEAAIADFMEQRAELKEPLKELRATKKTLDGLVESVALQDDERLRCGRFVIYGKARAGGGFEVPEWRKVFAGKIEDIGETA